MEEDDDEDIQALEENEEAEINNIKTLYGFVDEDSIDIVTSRAEENLHNLQVLILFPLSLLILKFQKAKELALQQTEGVIKSINHQISQIHLSKSDLDFHHTEIIKKQDQIRTIGQDLLQIFRSIEKVHSQIDTLHINLPPEKIDSLFEAIVLIHS